MNETLPDAVSAFVLRWREEILGGFCRTQDRRDSVFAWIRAQFRTGADLERCAGAWFAKVKRIPERRRTWRTFQRFVTDWRYTERMMAEDRVRREQMAEALRTALPPAEASRRTREIIRKLQEPKL